MLSDLVSHVLPLALGSAVSPTLLAVTLLILSGKDHARIRGAFFTGGSLVVLIAVAAVVLAAGSETVQSGAKHTGTISAIVDVAAGVLLLALAVRRLSHKAPPREHKPHTPSTGTHPLRFFAFGLLMMAINVTTIVLFIDGMKVVAHSSAGDSSKAAAAGLLGLFAILPALGPLIACAIAPGPAGRALAKLNRAVSAHARSIGITVLVVFGAYLTIKGARAL